MCYDLVILTDDHHENFKQLDWQTLQTRYEDEMLNHALQKLGLKTAYVSWSNQCFDWRQVKAVLFRSTWDYYYRFDEFLQWINDIKNHVITVNSQELIAWNTNKKYLIDLKKKGITVIESVFIEQNEKVLLASFFEQFACSDFIVKPQISGSARNTFKVNKSNVQKQQLQFDQLILKDAFMVQPFQKNVIKFGEISLMVINGRFTHAVQKKAMIGDFRVQSDHGGTVEHYCATRDEINFAEKVVTSCKELPLYARVDVIRDNNGQLSLMELELIEPELFFRFHQPAAFRLADAFVDYLTVKGSV